MFQVAGTVGIARSRGLPVSLPPDWDYRPYLCCPDEWFAPPGRHPLEAPKAREVAHIDPAARIYLQDLSLFAHCADEIRAAFQPSPQALELMWQDHGHLFAAIRDCPDRVVLNVRRGDTITNDPGYQPFVGTTFYDRALVDLVGLDDATLFVFSDDPDWCERELPRALGRQVTVARTTDPRPHELRAYRRSEPMDWVDLQLAAVPGAIGRITTNSTYSLWGAWLSGDENVRYPERWHGPLRSHIDASLMIPDHWKAIPC